MPPAARPGGAAITDAGCSSRQDKKVASSTSGRCGTSLLASESQVQHTLLHGRARWLQQRGVAGLVKAGRAAPSQQVPTCALAGADWKTRVRRCYSSRHLRHHQLQALLINT